MVEIGGKPILLHIMRYYAHFGHKEFFIALGYKGEMIKKYFVDLHQYGSNLIVDFKERILSKGDENGNGLDWRIHLIETGLKTMTGGRIKQLQSEVGKETFMLTYGDGLSNVDLAGLLDFHKSHGKLATITAVRPPSRYGQLTFAGDAISAFSEKPQLETGWINGGFFILEPGIFDYIDDKETSWEKAPLERLAADGQLMAFRHDDFWQCMDTLREKQLLESLWKEGKAPWYVSHERTA